jgi:hypothetical protein
VAVLLCCVPSASRAAAVPVARPLVDGKVRTLLLTGCGPDQDWQAIAAAFAWRGSGQPGALTRLASCEDGGRRATPRAVLDYVDTEFVPDVGGGGGGGEGCWEACAFGFLYIYIRRARVCVCVRGAARKPAWPPI